MKSLFQQIKEIEAYIKTQRSLENEPFKQQNIQEAEKILLNLKNRFHKRMNTELDGFSNCFNYQLPINYDNTSIL